MAHSSLLCTNWRRVGVHNDNITKTCNFIIYVTMPPVIIYCRYVHLQVVSRSGMDMRSTEKQMTIIVFKMIKKYVQNNIESIV